MNSRGDHLVTPCKFIYPYFDNPQMLEHILAGMQYALGDLKADDSPSAKPGGKTAR